MAHGFIGFDPFASLADLARAAKEKYIETVQAISLEAGLSGGRALTDAELAELEGRVGQDIDRAAIGNVQLATRAKEQLARELKSVQESDIQFRSERSVGNALSKFGGALFDFAGGVTPVLIGVGVAVAIVAGFVAIRRV